MLTAPGHWRGHYHGDADELRFARQWSLSDRIRYYWPVPAVEAALERLLDNLSVRSPPPASLSQFLLVQYAGVGKRQILRPTPDVLVRLEGPCRSWPLTHRARYAETALLWRGLAERLERMKIRRAPPRQKVRPVRAKATRLLVEERRRRIMDLLEAQERVTVDELVARFDVSAVTIRGDLDALADAGRWCVHGGALKRVDAPDDMPIIVKETLHHAEKVRIGHAACQMIRATARRSCWTRGPPPPRSRAR